MGGTVVIGELAEIGYDAEWRVVSAAGLGAPHRRDRIIIVAYPDDHGSFTGTVAGGIETANGYAPERSDGCADVERRRGVLADASGEYLESGISRECGESVSERTSIQIKIDRGSGFMADAKGSHGRNTEPYGLCPRIWKASELRKSDSPTGTVGDWWKVEPDVGRVANGVPSRVDRLRGLGNAVVPQVAEYVGRLVMAVA